MNDQYEHYERRGTVFDNAVKDPSVLKKPEECLDEFEENMRRYEGRKDEHTDESIEDRLPEDY